MVEAEIARRRAADTDAAVRELEGNAIAVRAGQAAHPAAFDLSFLVERAGQDRFGEAVAALRKQLGDRIELRYVGPLPPFSFAQDGDAVRGGAWA